MPVMRTSTFYALLCVALFVTSGCANISIKKSRQAYRSGGALTDEQVARVKVRAVEPTQINTDAAMSVGVFVGEGEAEEHPRQVNPAHSVVDMAKLTSWSPRVCFEVLLQSELSFDAPLEQLEPVCVFDDGAPVPASVVSDTQRTYDYWYHVPVQILWTTERVMHVAMRAGEICCPGEPHAAASLLLRHRWISYSDDRPWALEFRWELQR